MRTHLLRLKRPGRITPAADRLGRGGLVMLGLIAQFAVWTGQAEEPAPLFVKSCSPCHGKDGKAGTPAGRKLRVKDLTQSKLGEAEIQKQILEGKQAADGSGKMPSFRDSLKAEEIEALARYVKSLQATAKPGASSGK